MTDFSVVMCIVLCNAFLLSAQPCCYCMTVCSCAKDDGGKCRKSVQCLAETVAVNNATKMTRKEFTDADELFAHMIEPITPPKFFT